MTLTQGGTDSLSGQASAGTHMARAVEGQDSPQANRSPLPMGDTPTGSVPGSQRPSGTHASVAAGEEGRLAARFDTAPILGPPLADPFLALAADVLDDLEKVRIANENRLRQLTRTGPDADGVERGFGLTLAHPAVARLAAMVRATKCDSAVVTELTGEKPGKRNGCCLEHDAERNLTFTVRRSPLYPWLEAITGIGEKQGGRLLGAIGDPYLRPELSRRNADGEVVSVEPARPRKLYELWAFCGLHVIKTPVSGHFQPGTHTGSAADGSGFPGHAPPGAQTTSAREGGDPGHQDHGAHSNHAGVAPKRQRGQRSNWSATAKMRVFLIAESCIKQAKSPYRPVYDEGRTRYADAVHDLPCVRCGPGGSPAQPGSPLSAGHQHARAMRLVMKEILRDLWIEARRLHGGFEAFETSTQRGGLAPR
jgi:hypothetical protein